MIDGLDVSQVNIEKIVLHKRVSELWWNCFLKEHRKCISIWNIFVGYEVQFLN